ncbi:hypothetical protein BBP40_009541 [Aspergillus hancockii]|nr:hypothetical protein BBP40_009541 [Aspergillus hancockii]
MWDPSIHYKPDEFDGYRFLKLREKPGHGTLAQLVSPPPESQGFGFEKHALPGRFFAANQVNVLLCQILLKTRGGNFIRSSGRQLSRNQYRGVSQAAAR